MGTVRNIERRMFVRRQTDRDLQSAATGGAAPRLREQAVEWNGVWSGYMVFLGVEGILLSLVLGIGFSSLNPLRASSWASVGGGVLIWAAIATFIATYIGAWVAGRTPAATKRHGIAKGIVLWGLIVATMLVVVLWIGSQAVTVASGAVSAVGQAAPAATGAEVTRVQGVLQTNGITTLTQAQVTDVATSLVTGDRAAAATTLSRDAGIPAARANTVLNQVQATAPVTAGGLAAAGRSLATGAKRTGGSFSWAMMWLSLITLGCAIGGGATGGGGLKFGGWPRSKKSSPTPAT